MKLLIKIYISFIIFLGIYCIFNIHLIPHSHMDPGWVYTVDEYYSLNISRSFNNMLKCLSENKNRTFVICEIIYFLKWYTTELNLDLYPTDLEGDEFRIKK